MIFRYAYQSEPNKVYLAFMAVKNGATIPVDLAKTLYKNFSTIYGENPMEILS
jgi:hypothetical protein